MKTLLTTLTSLLLSATMSFAALDFTSGFTIDGAYDDVGSSVDSNGISFSSVIGVTGGTISGYWDSAQDASDFSGFALEAIGTMTDAPNLGYDLVFYSGDYSSDITVTGGNWSTLVTTSTAGSSFNWSDIGAVDFVISAGADVSVGGSLTGIQAVPEPSTYALLAGFAAFIFVAIRRRNS
jgi:hypothetical protein